MYIFTAEEGAKMLQTANSQTDRQGTGRQETNYKGPSNHCTNCNEGGAGQAYNSTHYACAVILINLSQFHLFKRNLNREIMLT